MTYLCLVGDTFYQVFDSNLIPESDGTFDCLLVVDSQVDASYYLFMRSPADLYRKTHSYCRRVVSFDPTQTVSNEYSNLTFQELRSRNITSVDLYNWNAPMDIIEDYHSGTENGVFVNCSNSLWFGSNCEYTLDSSDDLSSLIDQRFLQRLYLHDNIHWYNNGTCYEMINSNDCESILCLDWREICDGK